MNNKKILIRLAIALIAFLLAMYLLSRSGYNSTPTPAKTTDNQTAQNPTSIVTFEEEKE